MNQPSIYWQVKLRFFPNQQNPQRFSGRGVWRVVASYPSRTLRPRIQMFPATDLKGGGMYLYLNAHRQYLRRSRVDPRKVLGI
jgi:hypothetical protein